MKQPLNLTEEEQDLLLDMLSEEIQKVNNSNYSMREYLQPYREKVINLYKKIVSNMDED